MNGVPSSASVPDPTPLLLLAAAAAVFLFPDGALVIVAAVCTLLVILPGVSQWVTTGPESAALVVVLACSVPRLSVEVGTLNAHPEHMVSALLLCATPFFWRKRQPQIRWIWPDYFLLAYLAMNLVSSTLNSIDPSQTSKWAVQQVLAILPYFWLRLFIPDMAAFRKAFDRFLVIGMICSGVAMVCFYSYMFLGTSFGVETEQYVDIAGTFGLQFEANLLGAFSAALAAMLMAMYLFEGRRKYLYGFAFLAMIALTASLSRGAVGGAVIGLLAVGIYAYMRKRITVRVVTAIAVASICGALLIVPLVMSHYTERFSTVTISDPGADPNTLTRAIQLFAAIGDIAEHPIMGSGTSSFQLTFQWKDYGPIFDWESVGWISNTELRVLHDTGVIGLMIFSSFVAILAFRSWKMIREGGHTEILALSAGALVYLVTFQATEGTLLAFPWVHLGLIACALSLATEPRSKTEPAGDLAPSPSTI
jgi:O-antigen ligase